MKIGVLGGTFDPIHLGHVEAALVAFDAMGLDRLLLLPSRTPPHRPAEPRASAFHRFAMTAMAAAQMHRVVASDMELRRDGPSYTSLTLEQLHADGCLPSQLYFILGADAFSEIGTWHEYPRLLELSNFVVVSRPGFSIPDPRSPIPGSRTATSVFFIEAATPDVSSSEIRRRIASGESISDMVPRAVADHIEKHRLYSPAPVAAAQ